MSLTREQVDLAHGIVRLEGAAQLSCCTLSQKSENDRELTGGGGDVWELWKVMYFGATEQR